MLKKVKPFLLATLAAFCLSFIGCPKATGGNGDGGEAETKLTLSSTSIEMTKVGETQTITATYTGSDTLDWSLSTQDYLDMTVAEDTLSASFTAKKAGNTTVTVKEQNGSLSATASINNSITASPVTGLAASASDANSITISWTAPENYESFTVKAYLPAADEGSEASLVKEATVEKSEVESTSYSYTFDELTKKTEYNFEVYTNYGGVVSTAATLTASTTSASITIELEGDGFASPAVANSTITLIATVQGEESATVEWSSSDTNTATVLADSSDANKAVVTAVGPSGTVNITASFGDSSKVYEITIVGAAIPAENVAISAPSYKDNAENDKTATVTWTAPAYYSSFKVELWKADATEASYSADVEKLDSGSSYVYTFEDVAYGTYTAKVYAVYGEDISSAADSSASAEVKDEKPCAEVSGLKLDLTGESPVLSWTNPEDSDFANVKIYVDEDTISVSGTSSNSAVYAMASSIKITTVDSAGNESEGITVTVGTKVSLGSSVATGYTGQLVISDVTFDSSVEYSAVYGDSSVEDASVVLDTENSKVYVNGLTLGTAVAPSVTFTETYDDYDIVYKSTAETSVAPVKIVWELANSFTNNTYYLAFDLTSERTYANGVIATKKEIEEHGCTYDRFIVWPALNQNANGVSLELSNGKAESSDYYVISKNDTTNQGSWWRSNSWVSGCNDYTLFAVEKGSIEDTKSASYVIGDSEYSSDVNYITLNWLGDTTRYVRGFCYHATTIVPGTSTTADNASEALSGADYAWLKNESVWSGTESTDAPTVVAVSSTSTDHSITLTWTDPSDIDFSHVVISTTGTQLDGTTAVESQTISAGVQSATFINLSADTEYTFTFTEYDVFENTSAGTFAETPKTEEDTTPTAEPTDVKVVQTSATQIKVTWTDPSDADFKEIQVDVGETSNTVAAGVQTGTFTVDADTTVSVTVSAVDYNENSIAADSVSIEMAQPSPSYVKVEQTMTGSLLVTWTDTGFTDTTYTYNVSATSSGIDTVTEKTGIASGTTGALFTGLTVGNNYTFTVTAVADSTSYGSVTSDATEAVTVIWQLGNGYQNSSNAPTRFVVQAATNTAGTESAHIAALKSDVVSYAGYWIVRPALSGTEGYFSLEAAKVTTGLGTAKYMYLDPNSSYAGYNGAWSYGGHSTPYAVAASTSDITDNSLASFKFETTTYGTAWSNLVCEYGSGKTYKVTHNSLTFWGTSYSATDDSNGCGAFIISSTATSEKDYSVDAPSAVTNLTPTDDNSTEISFTATWTDPSDADLDYIVLSYVNSSNADDAGFVKVSAGKGTCTVSGLTAGATYSVSAVAYDVYGNYSDASTADVTVTKGTNKAKNVTATARFTGEILVTWDRAEDDTDSSWQYKVECSDSSVTAQSFTTLTAYAGTYSDSSDGVAQFKGLTSGTEYTFTVSASSDGSTWNKSTSVSATAATVTKKIISKAAYTSDGSNNCELNTVGAATSLCCQYSTGGGNAQWNVYPALDGSITVSHSYTTSSETKTGVYDTFSIYHTTKGYLTFDVSALTATTASELSTNVSCSTSSSTDTTGGSSFFFGYNSTDSCYTFRLNVADNNYALGFTKTSVNATEIIYYNNATAETCESTAYAWYFE